METLNLEARLNEKNKLENKLDKYYWYVVDELIGRDIPERLENGELDYKRTIMYANEHYAAIIVIPKEIVKWPKKKEDEEFYKLMQELFDIKREEEKLELTEFQADFGIFDISEKDKEGWIFNDFGKRREGKIGKWRFTVIVDNFTSISKIDDLVSNYKLFDICGYTIYDNKKVGETESKYN